MRIKLTDIIPDPNQPRKTFNPKTLAELKDSLDGLGLIQPITVRPYQDGEYMIIVGERRFTAATQRGDDEIECIIREDVDDKTAREMQFAENSQQETVLPRELGRAFHNHIQKYHLDTRKLANIIGVSQSKIIRYVALYNDLNPRGVALLDQGKLDPRTAFEISRITEPRIQEDLAQFIADKQVSRDNTVKLVSIVKVQPNKLDEIKKIVSELPNGKRDKLLDSILCEITHKTIKKTQDIIVSIKPEIKTETPEDLRRVAQTLYKEATKQEKAQLTPHEVAQRKAEMEAKKTEREAKSKAEATSLSPAVKLAIIDEAITRNPDLVKQAANRKKLLDEQARQQRITQRTTVNHTNWSKPDIILGDISDWENQNAFGIKPSSIDAIITDPPYPREYLPLFDYLASFSKFVLKLGGSLFVMVGQSYLPNILTALSGELTYHWELTYLTPGGQSPQLWVKKVNSFWKPILWFVNGEYEGKWMGDVIKSEVNDNDKDFHEWGQSESGMVDLILRATELGNLILDPFMGGGTTGKVALERGRRFIGIDNSQESVNLAKQRLGLV